MFPLTLKPYACCGNNSATYVNLSGQRVDWKDQDEIYGISEDSIIYKVSMVLRNMERQSIQS